jgi:hypothetical protein
VPRGRIVTFMAGAEAEVECLEVCTGGEEDDRHEINSMLDDFPDLREQSNLTRYAERLRRHTRGLVRRHRAAIDLVAAALLKRRTLSAAEVDILVGAATPICAPWEPAPWEVYESLTSGSFRDFGHEVAG